MTITAKAFCLLHLLLFSCAGFAQSNKDVAQRTVYGKKPDQTAMVDAEKLEAFMEQKPRISITVKGKVVHVIKEKGGWFTVDAGHGKVIAAHFKDYNINIPADLKGKIIIMEGVAEKQFIADSQQHYAGKEEQDAKKSPRQLSFEVAGLMVE